MKRLLALLLLLPATALAAVLLVTKYVAPAGGGGGACTDGVDCFCDVVTTTDNILTCEDFEDPSYYVLDANSWEKEDGLGTHNRGGNSAWNNYYLNGVAAGLWDEGQPASPRVGNSCLFGGGLDCVGQYEWCSEAQGDLVDGGGADCWDGNNLGAFIDIQRDGDVDEAVAGLTLTGGNSGDVFDGLAHLAQPVWTGNPMGTHGNTFYTPGENDSAWRAETNIGVAMAIAFASNVDDSGILDFPWKQVEYLDSGGAIQDAWHLGNVQSGGVINTDLAPYGAYFIHSGQSACNTAVSGATVHIGTMNCDDAFMRMATTAGVYSRATDFPPGTWHCHQAKLAGLGTSNTSVEWWHDGVKVFYVSGLDTASSLAFQTEHGFVWNAYANANQEGGTPISESTYKYYDNMLWTDGDPVSCTQLGF